MCTFITLIKAYSIIIQLFKLDESRVKLFNEHEFAIMIMARRNRLSSVNDFQFSCFDIQSRQFKLYIYFKIQRNTLSLRISVFLTFSSFTNIYFVFWVTLKEISCFILKLISLCFAFVKNARRALKTAKWRGWYH